jgi:hypothetical protein
LQLKVTRERKHRPKEEKHEEQSGDMPLWTHSKSAAEKV